MQVQVLQSFEVQEWYYVCLQVLHCSEVKEWQVRRIETQEMLAPWVPSILCLLAGDAPL